MAARLASTCRDTVPANLDLQDDDDERLSALPPSHAATAAAAAADECSDPEAAPFLSIRALPARLELELLDLQDNERMGNSPTPSNELDSSILVFGCDCCDACVHSCVDASVHSANTLDAENTEGPGPLVRQASHATTHKTTHNTTAFSSSARDGRRSSAESTSSNRSHDSARSAAFGRTHDFGRKLMKMRRQVAFRSQASPVMLQEREFHMRMREAADAGTRVEINFCFESYTVADENKAADVEAIIERYSRQDGTETAHCATCLDNIRDKILPLHIVRETGNGSSPVWGGNAL